MGKNNHLTYASLVLNPRFVTRIFFYIIYGVKVFLTSDLEQPEDGRVYVTSKQYACDDILTSVKKERN